MDGTTIEININFPTELTNLEQGTVRKAINKAAYDAIKHKYEFDLNHEFVTIRAMVRAKLNCAVSLADQIVETVLSSADKYYEIKYKLSLIKEREEKK